MAINSVDDAVVLFRARRNLYETYSTRLEGLLRDLLLDAKVDVIQIESRAKTVDSFRKKIERKDKAYENPLNELTDLVGTRIIAYYLEDLEVIGQLLRKEFSIDEKNTVDKASELRPNEFGYVSSHYIVSLRRSRAGLPEWAPYASIKAEIQVRTSLQHAWAAVSHKLSYKTVADVPLRLQRRLSRLGALFELADQEFSALRSEQRVLASKYAEDVRTQDTSGLPIDANSLDAYIAFRKIDSVTRQADPNEEWFKLSIIETLKGTDDEQWDRNLLVRIFNLLAFRTVRDVERLLGDSPRSLDEDLRVIVPEMAKFDIVAASIYDVAFTLVLLRADLSKLSDLPTGSREYRTAISEARHIAGYGGTVPGIAAASAP